MKIPIDPSNLYSELEKFKAFTKAYENFQNVLNNYKCLGYHPLTKEAKLTLFTASKIGGIPYLRNSDD